MQLGVLSGHGDSKARPVPGIWDIRGTRVALMLLNGPYRYNLSLNTTALKKYEYGHISVYKYLHMWPLRLTRQDLLEW